MPESIRTSLAQFDHLDTAHFQALHDSLSERDREERGWIFNEEIERQITEVHQRESGRGIVWLLWVYDEDGDYTQIPQLHATCTNEYSIRYHVGALYDQNRMTMTSPYRHGGEISFERFEDRVHAEARIKKIFVERTPVDHGYGSEMLKMAQEKMFFSKPISIVAQARRFDFGGEE